MKEVKRKMFALVDPTLPEDRQIWDIDEKKEYVMEKKMAHVKKSPLLRKTYWHMKVVPCVVTYKI